MNIKTSQPDATGRSRTNEPVRLVASGTGRGCVRSTPRPCPDADLAPGPVQPGRQDVSGCDPSRCKPIKLMGGQHNAAQGDSTRPTNALVEWFQLEVRAAIGSTGWCPPF